MAGTSARKLTTELAQRSRPSAFAYMVKQRARLISDVSAKPVYISSFFAGKCRQMAIANCWNKLKQPVLMLGTGWQRRG